MSYKKGDKVIITDNDMLGHCFELGQECTYLQDYGGNIHDIEGIYVPTKEFIKTPIQQSVFGTSFTKK